MRSQTARWFWIGIASLALMGLGLIAAPRLAGATVSGDVRAGVYPNSDAVALGGGVLAPVGTSGHWYFNPNVELARRSGPDFVAMSGDFHYDFARDGNATFWMVADRPCWWWIARTGPTTPRWASTS